MLLRRLFSKLKDSLSKIKKLLSKIKWLFFWCFA